MSEDSRGGYFLPAKTRYIEVQEENLTGSAIGRVSTIEGEAPLNADISETERKFASHNKETVEQIENRIRTDAIVPGERLKQAFDIARNYINKLNTQLGYPEINEDRMEILFLSEPDFEKHLLELTGKKNEKLVACAGDFFEPCLVSQREDFPDYFTASFALHELVHKWMELDVRVFNYQTFSVHNRQIVTSEGRRSGLKVDKIRKDKEGRVRGAGAVNLLLNELPNFHYQRNFIKQLLETQKGSELFKDEIEARKNGMSKLGLEPGGFLALTMEDGRTLKIDEANVHFDNNEGYLFSTTPFLASQLSDDLEKVVGEIDGQSFNQLLLKSKIELKLQGKIRKAVDKKMGKGFFRKLKDAKYESDDIVDLLIVVQQKLGQDARG